jgi:hypothetical protein
MKRIAMFLFLLLLAAGTAPAQGSGSPPPKMSTLTGCLNGPNAENAYIVTNRQYKRGVEVGMPGSDELSKHVGHKVRLSGTWESSGTAIGENEAMEKKSGEQAEHAGAKHFKVSRIEHMAESCTMGGSGATGAAASAPGNKKEGAIAPATTDDKMSKKDQEAQKKQEEKRPPSGDAPKW